MQKPGHLPHPQSTYLQPQLPSSHAMKLSIVQAAIGSASVILSAHPASANLGHRHAHIEYARRHGHGHGHEHRQADEIISAPKVAARKASCSLPDDPDLVHVPGDVNNGFAMSPDEPCEDGKWCPIACRPGKVMAQWKPDTVQVYPESMVGGPLLLLQAEARY